jgi:hypothetical protein
MTWHNLICPKKLRSHRTMRSVLLCVVFAVVWVSGEDSIEGEEDGDPQFQNSWHLHERPGEEELQGEEFVANVCFFFVFFW